MDSVCPDSTPLSGSENDNLEKNAEKMDDVDKMSKGSENTIYSICEFLTYDDFVCLKMLSALWLIPRPNFKIKRSDVKTPMILFKSLHNRVTDDVEFNSIIIELLFTIKRYDLLKKLKVCKHNSAKFIQNRIDPIWKECFKLVEQFDPNGKDVEKFVINLTTLVQSEKNPRLEWILESLLDLIDSTILDEIRIKINELTDLPYPMDGDPCGICLIINNKKFDNPKKFPARDGTEADKEALSKLFTEFCFEVRVHDDCTGAEMKKQLTNLAEENHVNSNCIIICILSHGEEGRVIGVDGQMISIDKDVVAEFTSKSSLAGKPKLFFIQACQGNDRLRPVSEPVESGENSLPPLPINDNLSPDSAADLASDAVASHPAKSDYLLCLPTVEGYAAYRNKNSGTWFIMTLVEKLRLFGCKEDIMTIMRRVNNQVADAVGKIDGEKVKQQPVQKTTLRKQLIFKKKNKKNI